MDEIHSGLDPQARLEVWAAVKELAVQGAPVLLGRSLRHITRCPDTIITTTVMPVASGGAYTAYRLFHDLKGGIFGRFQSMPIARPSVLWAHVTTSLVANLVSVIVVVVVALIMGFRSGASVLAWLAITGILVLFTLALTWLAVFAGLSATTVDGASAFSYPLMFLPFISSAFVPAASMTGAVQWFAEHRLVTSIVRAIRELLAQAPVGGTIWVALAWCVGILMVAYTFALVAYRRKFL